MNNENSDVSGLKYVLIEPEKVEVKKEPMSLSEKEIRAEFFKRAAEKGLTPAKNIKTEDLIKLIEN